MIVAKIQGNVNTWQGGFLVGEAPFFKNIYFFTLLRIFIDISFGEAYNGSIKRLENADNALALALIGDGSTCYEEEN